MKLSEREQNLLFTLLIVALGVVGYLYVFTPAKEKLTVLEGQVIEKRNQEKEARAVMAISETIDADIEKAAEDARTKSRSFFKRAEIEYIHKWISMLAESNSLRVTNLDISEEELTTVQVYGTSFTPVVYPIGDYYNGMVNTAGDGTIIETEEEEAFALRDDDEIMGTQITVDIQGTNVQLTNFVDYLSNINKHIVVNSFAFEDRQSTDIQETSVDLTIYSIDKDEEDIFKGYFIEEEQVQESE